MHWCASIVFRITKQKLGEVIMNSEIEAKTITELTVEEMVTLTCLEVEQVMGKTCPLVGYMKDRDTFIRKYGFSVPCKEAYDRIKQSEKIIGIGSGTGYWEKVLNIPAFDDHSGDYSFKHDDSYVQKMSAKAAVLKYPDHDVFCSWPSYRGEWFTEAVKAMQPGRLLYYIGEGYGGCTAADSFHALKLKRVDDVDIPRWRGMNDYLQVFRITTTIGD
jgi:hypothetical protein